MKAVCNKRRRDKHCCEKLKQIPYPKFRDRKFVKGLHNNVDHARSPSSLQSEFVTHGYEKGLWRTTNNLSKEFALRVQGESRFQVSRKVAFTLKFLFFALSNNHRRTGNFLPGGAVIHLPKNSCKLPKFLQNSRKETRAMQQHRPYWHMKVARYSFSELIWCSWS